MPSPQEILTELKKVKYPGFTRDIVSFGLVKDIEVGHSGVTVMLSAPSASPEIVEPDRRGDSENRRDDAWSAGRQGRSRTRRAGRAIRMAAPAKSPVPGVSRIVAVASGKGGVGKSTVAVNLTLAMAALGRRVGLMDADVYGPSVAMMVGQDRDLGAKVTPERRIVPIERFGIRYVSMALFIGEQTPVIWRGPMVTKLETEFLFNVEWGQLDCLVLDLPPGTGDAQLTITQRVALDGGVIVTTPQADRAARRAARGRDVQRSRHAGARRDREHELLHLPQVRPSPRDFRPRRRPADGGGDEPPVSGRDSDRARAARRRRYRQSDRRHDAGPSGERRVQVDRRQGLESVERRS